MIARTPPDTGERATKSIDDAVRSCDQLIASIEKARAARWRLFLFAIPLFVAVAIASPLVVIWALNTLFSLNIEFTFWTWLACLVVLIAFGRPSAGRVKS